MTNFDSRNFLKIFRDELGGIAEHLIRATGIAALSGVLFRMTLFLWPKVPTFDQAANLKDYLTWACTWSMAISTFMLIMLSALMIIFLILDIETRVNKTSHTVLFWIFGILCLVSLFAIIGAAYFLVESIPPAQLPKG